MKASLPRFQEYLASDMSEIKLCGLALCGVMLCAVFKSSKNEYSLFVRIGISVLVSLLSFTLFLPILSFVDEITKNTAIYEYIPTLIKVFGIAVAVPHAENIRIVCKRADKCNLLYIRRERQNTFVFQ